MLPNIGLYSFSVGPITLYWWGGFVALGIAVTLLLARHLAQREKLSFDHIIDLSVWTVAAALVGSRLMHVFFYEPAFFFANPAEILKVWHGGMSSTGGIILGTSAAIAYIVRNKLDIRAYGDIIARAIPASWVIGRLGCFFTHTHPGTLSNLSIAVKYPEGGRLELSIIEACLWAVIGGILWFMPRPRRAGMYVAVLALAYAPARFAIDFLRVDNARYAGLTPAQYVMIGLFAVGIFGYFRFKTYDA